MMTKTTIGGGVLVIGAAALAWYALSAPHAHGSAVPTHVNVQRQTPGVIGMTPDDPQLSFLKIGAVSMQPLPLAEPVAARIAYDESRTSRVSSPLAGRVLALRAEIGDSVKAGQVLAELDSPDLATVQADERKAAADEERKRLALARVRLLADAEVVPRKDLDEANADFRQADAEARRARQRIGSLQAHGGIDGHFAVRAPLAGVVADRQINPGQEVRPDQATPLFVVSNVRKLWVLADVPEQVAAKLQPGQAALVETDAWPGQTFRARIGRIGVAVDAATRRVQVRCELDNSEGRLKPEMFARIAFSVSEGGAAAVPVPNTALVTEGLYTYVYVERGRGRFEKRRVHVALGSGTRSWVDDGLRSDERIVTEGALLLQAEVANHAG